LNSYTNTEYFIGLLIKKSSIRFFVVGWSFKSFLFNIKGTGPVVKSFPSEIIYPA